LASACLPSLFQAVEIDGVPYWDGGYAGNPTMTPLINECDSRDTVLVQINPVVRTETPRSARDIASRLNEVSFNAQLLKELRMMAMMRRVIDPGLGEAKAWKEMRMHRITTDLMVTLGHSSKLNAEWAFLEMLFNEGRRSATAFGQAHLADIGVRSTFDIDTMLEEV
jgi:NTE family protein